MINFCQIAPTAYLDEFCTDNEVDLILAHLVETDSEYTEWYRNHKAFKILDNSAFEMYKQGRPMYDSDKLLEMGKRVGADVIVMSDYPGEEAQKTIDAAERLGPIFHEAGFKTFFVPQSQIGDMDDYMKAWKYAATSENVDFIGVSILGVPNAFGGIEKDNKLQRFMSRFAMMNLLNQEGTLGQAMDNGKKLHFLGALDGWPGEVELVQKYHNNIFSWDSSGAVWLGLSGGKEYDNSPTQQIDGKYEEEVDFNFNSATAENIAKAHHNIEVLHCAQNWVL
jgi:hypothetical protein